MPWMMKIEDILKLQSVQWWRKRGWVLGHVSQHTNSEVCLRHVTGNQIVLVDVSDVTGGTFRNVLMMAA